MGYFHPKIIYDDPNADYSNALLEWVGDRVNDDKLNQNFLCAVTGSTGKGKSWLCLSIAEIYAKMYNKTFHPDKHVFWDLDSFVAAYDSVLKNQDKDITYGSILQFEEPQVQTNSRKWQADANEILNILTSTGRDRRLIVLFSTPILDFIDRQSRILFHCEIKVDGFDATNGITRCSPRFLEYNKAIDGFFYKQLIISLPRATRKGRDNLKLNQWEVPKASKEIIDAYLVKKIAFGIKQGELLKKKLAKKEDKAELFLKCEQIYRETNGNLIEIIKRTRINPNLLAQWHKMWKDSGIGGQNPNATS